MASSGPTLSLCPHDPPRPRERGGARERDGRAVVRLAWCTLWRGRGRGGYRAHTGVRQDGRAWSLGVSCTRPGPAGVVYRVGTAAAKPIDQLN